MKIRVLSIVVLLFASAAFAAETKPDAPAPKPAALTTEQKTALEAADKVIARFDALLAKDDDVPHRTASQKLLDDYKQRAAALHQEFDQSRYDELRIDLNLEYQRLSRWMATPINPPPPAKKSANAATTK